MKDYRKLVVWEKAHKLTLFIYNITRAFPKEEQYGLISQIRRAATSTPTNIAEGCGKNTQTRFCSIPSKCIWFHARGSILIILIF